MRNILSFLRSRRVELLGLTVLGLTQTGCAHPVWVEPSVAIHARVGVPVHAPIYGPPGVLVAPSPVWIAPPGAVVVSPRVFIPAQIGRPHGQEGRRAHQRRHDHKHWR